MSRNAVVSWSLVAEGHRPRSGYLPWEDEWLEGRTGPPETIALTRRGGERAYRWSPRREKAVRKAYDRPRSAARLLYTSEWDESGRRFTTRDVTAEEWPIFMEHMSYEDWARLRDEGWRNLPAWSETRGGEGA